MNTIESKLEELDKLNRYQTKYGESVISSDIQNLIAALREAVETLARIEQRGGTDGAIAESTLASIENILNGGK